MKGEQESFTERKGLKIAVFGAGGAVGSILTDFLQKMPEASQITCIDCNLKDMFKFLKNRGKILPITADMDNNGDYGNTERKLIKVLKDHFLVINAMSSKYNRKIMKIASIAGDHYMDFASLGDKKAEQKEFHVPFQENHKSAWINWGVGPGLTNLLAAKQIKGLRDCDLKIRVAESTKLKPDENGKRPLIFLWSPKLVIDEITSPVYDSRREDIVREPFSGPEFCIFPYPIDKITCRQMNENEIATMTETYPHLILRKMDVKTGGNDIEALFELYPKIRKLKEKQQLDEYTKQFKTPSPDKIKKMIDEGIILDGRVAILIEVDGEDPKKKERILKRAIWMGLGIREVPRGTTHINFNTAVVAHCAIQQMIATKELRPGVWAPEEVAEEKREAILECVQKITNPVHFETL